MDYSKIDPKITTKVLNKLIWNRNNNPYLRFNSNARCCPEGYEGKLFIKQYRFGNGTTDDFPICKDHVEIFEKELKIELNDIIIMKQYEHVTNNLYEKLLKQLEEINISLKTIVNNQERKEVLETFKGF